MIPPRTPAGFGFSGFPGQTTLWSQSWVLMREEFNVNIVECMFALVYGDW